MERQVGVVPEVNHGVAFTKHSYWGTSFRKFRGRQINLVSCVASDTVNIFSSLSMAPGQRSVMVELRRVV